MDVISYRIVVGFVGLIGLLCAGGLVYLSVVGKPPSETLVCIGGTALGTLATILTGPKPPREPPLPPTGNGPTVSIK
jgi:hypothetical protein